jgi:peptidyl-prolyl cis-trans isomerase B (cyclophilin B)
VASKSNRARRLERARAERRLARLADQARRKRRVQAAIGGSLALIVIVLGTTWLLGGFDDDPAPVTLPTCTWTPRDLTEGVEETGLPPSNAPTSGVKTLTINTNLGEITAVIDVASAFCAAASVDFLAARGFYDGTECHVLDTTARTLTCGSRDGSTTTSPNYQFPTEGLPRTPLGTASPAPAEGADPSSYYLRGSIVMTNVDVNAVGSQFYIVYGDASPLPPEYTQIGTITSGLEIVDQVAAAGAVDGATSGAPTQELTITTLTVSDDLANPSPASSPDPSASADPSASPTEAAPSTSATS